MFTFLEFISSRNEVHHSNHCDLYPPSLPPLLILAETGFATVLIPWVVLQEMESLKKGRGLSGSVAHLATPAISYIYNSLKSRTPHLWGQSLQQASESSSKSCVIIARLIQCDLI